MYESKTFEYLMAQCMARVPDNVDKREGSVIYNALAPAIAEVAQVYIEMDILYNETFADTASEDGLLRRCRERDIEQDAATQTVAKGVFNIDVALGSRFTAGSYFFEAFEKISTGNYKLRAEVAGSGPNLSIGAIIPVEYIAGLTSAQITEILIPGEDKQDVESLRAEYFDSFDAQDFGGNKADYKAKANALPGVGGSKPVRTPGGGGTVGLTIIASDYSVPTPTLIADVQTAFDPVVNTGEGDGLAPIGHRVTVYGVAETTVNIASTITYEPGWDWSALEPYAAAMIDAYFLELKKLWEDEDSLVVRISQIESRYLDLPGVVDISGTTLNGLAQNVVLGANSVPKRGTVSG